MSLLAAARPCLRTTRTAPATTMTTPAVPRAERLKRQARRLQSTTTTTTKAAGGGGPTPDRPATAAAPKQPAEIAASAAPAASPPSILDRLGPLTSMFRAYGRVQRSRPYVTVLVSTVVIYAAADLSAQRMAASGGDEEEEEEEEAGVAAAEAEEAGTRKQGGYKHDFARTARTLAIGAASAIPTYEWFIFLAKRFNYPSLALSVATKVLVHQMVFAPTFNIFFFGSQSLLSGDSPGDAADRVRRTLPTSLWNGLKVWPAATAVSLAYVPLEYRAVFGGLVALGWQTYLSLLNRRAERAAAAARGGELVSKAVA